MNNISRQRRWQLKKIAEGKCSICGNDINESTSKELCGLCKAKHNARINIANAKNKEVASHD